MFSIIQCPSCKNKFAVESKIIKGLKSLNFHCSKCDAFFSKPESIEEISFNNDLANKTSLPEDNVQSNENKGRSNHSTSLIRVPKEEIVNDSIEEEYQDYEDEYSFKHKRLLNIFNSSFSFLKLKAFSKIGNFSLKGFLKKDRLEDINSNAPHEIAQIKNPLVTSSIKDEIKTENARPINKSSTQDPNQYQINFAQYIQSSWGSLVIMSSPILLFLSTLTLLTIYTRKEPLKANNIFNILAPSQLEATPQGLNITDSTFTRNIQDDGTVYTVTGSILNVTQESFSEINLQVFTYDSEGNEIFSKIFSINNKLQGIKLNELSKSKIIELTQKTSKKDISLPPQQKIDFKVCLNQQESNLNNNSNTSNSVIDNNISQSKYFATRIYSVRKE